VLFYFRTDAAPQFAVPSRLPPCALVSLAGSARRRLGQKRTNAAGNDTPVGPTTDVACSSNNSDTAGKAQRKLADLPAGTLHRAPSSLFYLQYEDKDEDGDSEDERVTKKRRVPRSDLPSSRKISAAAYAPRIKYVPSDEEDDEYADDEDDDDVVKIKGSVRHQDPAVKRVRRKISDNSVEKFYEETLRQVRCVSVNFYFHGLYQLLLFGN
jgi:hypothetical protein